MMKALEMLRQASEETLRGQLSEKRRELLNLNLRRQVDPIEKPHQFSELRRAIARIETILTERKMEIKR